MEFETRLRNTETDRLFEGILQLETLEDCYRFFEDLCTINEIRAFAQRFEVATMLMDKVTYQEIAQTTKASTATISRVNRCLNYGAGGYKEIMARLAQKERRHDS